MQFLYKRSKLPGIASRAESGGKSTFGKLFQNPSANASAPSCNQNIPTKTHFILLLPEFSFTLYFH
jgi:hypothetical protein